MKITHEAGVESLTHAGESYDAKAGVFDVPESVGRELVKRAGWSEWTGDAAVPPAGVDMLAGLEARMKGVEARLAALESKGAAKDKGAAKS